MKGKVGSLLLVVSLCLSLRPAAFADGSTYDKAVEELRNGVHYSRNSERTFETEDCTIFVYDNGGVMRPPHNRITIIYKAGSQPGEGVQIDGEYPYPMFVYHGPDRLDLSEDGKTFTYAYLLEEDIDSLRDENGDPLTLSAGIYTYTVDLPTGTTTPSYAPFSREELADVLAHGADYELEERLNGPFGTAILRWSTCVSPDQEGNEIRDYKLYLITEEGNPISQRLLLPSTINTNTAYSPTHLPPDSMGFSLDGESFTYVYTFDSELKRGDTVLHEAGTYTYTVDLTTGELEVVHTAPAPAETSAFADVPAGSWYEQGVRTCAEAGIMVGTGEGLFSPEGILTAPECLVLALRLYDLQQGGSGQLRKAPEDWGKITLTTKDGESISRYPDRFHFGPYNFGTSNANRPDLKLALPLETQEEMDWAETQSGKAATLMAGGFSTAGTVELSYIPAKGSALFFLPGKDSDLQGVNCAIDYCRGLYPGPEQWWRDAAYTLSLMQAKELQPGEVTPLTALYFTLLEYLPYKTQIAATRHIFAQSLADTVGDLEQLYSVEDLPDLKWDPWNGDIRGLYEAGVLTGVNEYGQYDADGILTRSQAAVMVARVLDKSQRVQTPPKVLPVGKNTTSKLLEVNRDYASYEEALAELRGRFGYHNERLFDTDICTVVVNDYGGMMHAQKGCISILYKSGSDRRDGTVLKPPHPGNDYSPLLSRNPDSMELSADKGTFTYSYHFEEPLEYNGEIIRAPGDFVYTVDLTAGTVTENIPTILTEPNS